MQQKLFLFGTMALWLQGLNVKRYLQIFNSTMKRQIYLRRLADLAVSAAAASLDSVSLI